MSLHPEPAAAPEIQPVATTPAAIKDAPAEPAIMSAEDLAMSGADFKSPFEDELDTPAFLRRAQD